jgi:hypothetical protein
MSTCRMDESVATASESAAGHVGGVSIYSQLGTKNPGKLSGEPGRSSSNGPIMTRC